MKTLSQLIPFTINRTRHRCTKCGIRLGVAIFGTFTSGKPHDCNGQPHDWK